MPIKRAAKKSIRQSATRKAQNLVRKIKMKKIIKEIKALSVKGSKEDARKLIPDANKAIDKAAKSGIIKKNNASRKKSLIARITN